MSETESDVPTKFYGLVACICGLLGVAAAVASVIPPDLSQPVDPVSLTMAIVFLTMSIGFGVLLPSTKGDANV